MLRRVALVRPDVSDELSASFIRVTRIGGLGTKPATSNRCTLLIAACVVPSSPIFVTLMKEAPGYSETSVLTRATRHNIPEDTILHSHRCENLKSYIVQRSLVMYASAFLCESTFLVPSPINRWCLRAAGYSSCTYCLLSFVYYAICPSAGIQLKMAKREVLLLQRCRRLKW
jgi:hypothetical protein